MTLSFQQRIENLSTKIAKKQIIRNDWIDFSNEERVCLLVAIAPETGGPMDASFCPVSVMPQWLAQITPELDDTVSTEYWPQMLKDYRDTARLFPKLDKKAWIRVHTRLMISVLLSKHSGKLDDWYCITETDRNQTLGEFFRIYMTSDYDRHQDETILKETIESYAEDGRRAKSHYWDIVAKRVFAEIQYEASQL